MRERPGTVYLVGAGPGASDLITMRGADCLRRADVVVYDLLANPDLLKLAPPSAEFIFAGRRAGDRREIAQQQLNRILIERARRGQTVVRLKGGDPFVFGRGGEEAESLADARVRFEIVPGVTSAIAAPAFAGIPVTHRRYNSFVTFVTGHEEGAPDAPTAVPWNELAAASRRGGTLVLLMATAHLGDQLRRLELAGLPGSTPAAAVQWGSTASQRSVSGTLATLAAECQRAKLGRPAVVVIGAIAELRNHLQWFEKLPLFGRRIVLTRAAGSADELSRALRELGAEAIEVPAIEIAPPSSYAAIDKAIARLKEFDWLIFTSANAVDAFVERVSAVGHDIRELADTKICAIGPATAARVRSHALRIAGVPREYRAEAIIKLIGARRIKGARILIPRAEVAREVLPAALRKKGAREVRVAPVYRTIKPRPREIDRVRELALAGEIDLVVFTSSSTATNFSAMLGKSARGLRAAVIGPITAATARKAGFKVVAQAKKYTIPGVIAALRAYYANIKRSPERASTRARR